MGRRVRKEVFTYDNGRLANPDKREHFAHDGWTLDTPRLAGARRIAVRSGGFGFLGYHFERDRREPRSKSLEKLKETIRTKTRRTNGHSLSAIIIDLNRTLKGWFGYFRHSNWWVFRELDRWIRMRLRSILRKRQGRRGRGRGSNHQRWPNACFAEMGLFSMLTAYRAASEPQRAH